MRPRLSASPRPGATPTKGFNKSRNRQQLRRLLAPDQPVPDIFNKPLSIAIGWTIVRANLSLYQLTR